MRNCAGVFLGVWAMVICVSSTGASAYSGGSGTEADPYRIAVVDDWATLSATTTDWNKHFVLISDINFGGISLTPVGDNIINFTGVLDGTGHVVRNGQINQPAKDYVGLFGYLGAGGEVRNLGADVMGITGNNYVGILAGWNDGTIAACFATGAVTGIQCIGGLVGENYTVGKITSCYATSAAVGTTYVGGLVGENRNLVTSCYSTGAVTTSGTGGLISNNGGVITGCFWDKEASGQDTSAGGRGLTTAQMSVVSYYQNAGWNAYPWVMVAGTPPRLAWEPGLGWPVIPVPELPPFSGTGTEVDPYLITSAAEFVLLSWNVSILDKHIRLMADLDLSGLVLYPIGDFGPFIGEFDGNGHVIRNGIIYLHTGDQVGLFGCLGTGGEIHNLGVELVNIKADDGVGGLVGLNYGAINLCYVTGEVSGDNQVGGLVGGNLGTITFCCTTDAVRGDWSIGGLVGYNYGVGTVTSCYSTGAVTGNSVVGALVGYKRGTMTSCYATGRVTGGSANIGGLVGYWHSGTETTCYWDMQTTGQSSSACGEGRTTDEMTYPYQSNTYVDWDFPHVWAPDSSYIVNNGYPYLLDCVPPNEAEGEGEALPEGEGEALLEGEGEVPPEGEGEGVHEGEILPEGEVVPEGEVQTEGEGEADEETVMLPGNVPLTMVWIPSGSFQMGCYLGEVDSRDRENPQHEVTFTQGFWMGKYEITQQQWLALMNSWPGTQPSADLGLGDAYPAYYISWDDTQNFMTALNAYIVGTGQGPMATRLPTEAEWEYACRANTQTRFYFGDSLDCDSLCEDCSVGVMSGNRTDYMWYCGNNSTNGTKPVGGKMPNVFGVYDMSGNVWEWCEDDWHENYLDAPTNGSAWLDVPRAQYRIFRGGGSGSVAHFCRSARRSYDPPNERLTFIGFRLAADQLLPLEGEGESEGEVQIEGEATVEGEGETPVEGEGEILPEGEGETPFEGEGEVPVEGEGEVLPEGEGEFQPEGEGENECSPDFTPPVLVCKNITVNLNATGVANLFSAATLYTTAAITMLYDTCDGAWNANPEAFIITGEPDVFDCDDVGVPVSTHVRAEDSPGNIAERVLTVTVKDPLRVCTADECDPDMLPPVIECRDIEVELNAAGVASLFDASLLYTTSAIHSLYDNCDGTWANNPSGFTVTAIPDTFNCVDVGTSVPTQIFVTDSSGNLATCNFTATVQDPLGVCDIEEGEGEPVHTQYLGDANLDGTINFDDVEYVILIAGGLVTPNPDSPSWRTADVDGNGDVTSDDALLVLLFVRAGGLITTPPEALRAESGGNQVTLFWEPVTHANLSGYAVYRRAEEESGFVRIGKTTSTVFTDATVKTTRYFYYVVALDIFENAGPPSETVSVWANMVRIWLPEIWGEPGTTVRIPLNFGNARGIKPKAMIFNIRFNDAILTYDHFEKTVLSSEVEFLDQVDGSNLLRIISIDPESSIAGGEGRFLDLYFKVAGSAPEGCTPLALEKTVVLDLNDVPVATIPQSGQFCIGSEIRIGDLNADGFVNEPDVMLLLGIITQTVEPTPYHRLTGDINCDGRFDSADVALLLRVIAGLPLNPEVKTLLKAIDGSTVHFGIPDLEAHERSQFTLPIALSMVDFVAGIDIVASWPKTELTLNTVRLGEVFSASTFALKQGDGYCRFSLGNVGGISASADTVIAYLDFTVSGKPTTSMNPAPVVRLNHGDVKYPYGESQLWFGDITLGDATIKILPASSEGEGEMSIEGEGEIPAEGEGEVQAEGEGELLPEGEGEPPVEGEGEISDEGEGEVVTEGEQVEGEIQNEGELEGESEGEDEACGCCTSKNKTLTPRDLFNRTLGDWLVIGVTLLTLVALTTFRKK